MPKQIPIENTQPSGQFACVNCGAQMLQLSCKVRCPRCGYFEDCSDGGNDQTNFYRKPI